MPIAYRNQSMPLIDSHVHFYDPKRPEGITYPSKESPIYKRSFPNDLTEFAKPVQINGVILVEASLREIDDEWMLELASKDPLILGVVANLQPGEAGFEERLKKFLGFPKLKGIRLRPIANYDLGEFALRRRIGVLATSGLTFELGANSIDKLRDYIDLAAELSDLTCILNHFGHVLIDGLEPTGEWRELMSRFAALPNTLCKLTSLLEFTETRPPSLDPNFYAPILDFLFSEFGENRVIFGSNWPPISMVGSYQANLDLYQNYLDGKEATKNLFFYHNAERIYRLDTRN